MLTIWVGATFSSTWSDGDFSLAVFAPALIAVIVVSSIDPARTLGATALSSFAFSLMMVSALTLHQRMLVAHDKAIQMRSDPFVSANWQSMSDHSAVLLWTAVTIGVLLCSSIAGYARLGFIKHGREQQKEPAA